MKIFFSLVYQYAVKPHYLEFSMVPRKKTTLRYRRVIEFKILIKENVVGIPTHFNISMVLETLMFEIQSTTIVMIYL